IDGQKLNDDQIHQCIAANIKLGRIKGFEVPVSNGVEAGLYEVAMREKLLADPNAKVTLNGVSTPVPDNYSAKYSSLDSANEYAAMSLSKECPEL
ncbi:MAG: hypothetical protein WBL28_04305, partial [Methylotenera sp.]